VLCCWFGEAEFLHILRAIEIIAVFGTCFSVAYSLLCLGSAANFLRQRRGGDRTVPVKSRLAQVSILKPLKGVDPGMYESLRSHCLQDDPEYEIIFGVSDSADPAVQLVKQLQTEFPQRAIRLKVCGENLGANIKVSNLVQMMREVRYEHIVVSDSDIRVEPGYLPRVIGPLGDPKIGLVTCLYRGVAAPTLGSRLESLGISTDFMPGVLVARQIESGIRFGLGSTLAFRRRDLAAIGGFEAIADYLADDYELGKRIAGLGLRVELSEVVVATLLPGYTFAEFLRHQLRWARTIRAARRGGYVGLLLTFGLAWSLLALLVSGGAAWAWGLLGAVVGLRMAIAFLVGRIVLGDRNMIRSLWLLPLRDLVAIAVWKVGLVGRTITWRGEKFRLKNGKLVRRRGAGATTGSGKLALGLEIRRRKRLKLSISQNSIPPAAPGDRVSEEASDPGAKADQVFQRQQEPIDFGPQYFGRNNISGQESNQQCDGQDQPPLRASRAD
jgi:ceramide glucosyltransferase